MKAFLSRFGTFRRLSARERFIVQGGAIVAVASLLVAFVVIPFVRHWSEREAALRAKADQLARLEELLDHQGEYREAVMALREGRGERSTRLLEGDTRALAASQLQALLRSYAAESRIVLGRIDLATSPAPSASADAADPEDGLSPVPVRLAAIGDVYGLVDFLTYLHGAEKLLVLDELTINANPQRRTGEQLLGWTIRLHGLYAAPAVGS
jgi:hypothetical protein